MFDKQQRKFRRSAKLIGILSKYGFRDILARMNVRNGNEPADDLAGNRSVYERIRLAIEELGPTFVKLGQAFSNREDLLPPELILELQKLQDKVEPVALDPSSVLAQQFNIEPADFFQELNATPIAVASIAQVYRAVLADGSPVILKIKKPGVDEQIQDDLLLIHDLVKVITNYSDIGERLNLKQAINTFEKSLLEELSLSNEKNNIRRFAINFRENPKTYVPKVYDEFCSNSVLCMEFIDGIKITDTAQLQEADLNPVLLSEAGLQLFVSQILDYGFFHADPHAGNILVLRDGRIVFIDFGAVGSIQPNEKEILEQLIIAFVSANASRIVKYLKKMAIEYDIPDERGFQKDVQTVLDYVHSTSLQEIEVPALLAMMTDTLKNNRILMPEYLYLLLKGISLIEGVGRTINPDLDVVKSLQPFTRKMLFKKLSPQHLLKSGTQKMALLAESLEEIPAELRSILLKLDENRFTIQTEQKGLEKQQQLLKTLMVNLVLSLVLCANIVSSALLLTDGWPAEHPSKAGFLIFSLLLSAILIPVLVLRLLKK